MGHELYLVFVVLPLDTSIMNLEAYLYRVGFAQPTGPFPTANRAAFTLEIKPATTEVAAEVE
jgi:hypothetical protein